MNRLFGSRNTGPKPNLNDAMSNIDERVAALDVRISKVNSELATYQAKLSKMRKGPAKSSVKQRAIKLLRQRNQLETQRDQLMSQSWNISQAQMTTENLKNTMITVDAIRQTNKELKKTYGKINIDKLEDMQDEMLDLIDQSNEVQQALGRSYDVPDDISESELDAELEALGDELQFEESNTEGLPSYLLDNHPQEEVPTFIEDQPESQLEDKELLAQ